MKCNSGKENSSLVFSATLRRVCVLAILCAGAAIAAHAQSFSLLYPFPGNGTMGYDPLTMNMMQGTDGNLYGTTDSGGVGSPNCGNYVDCGGVLFKVDTSGNYTLLYTFCSLGDGKGDCPDGRSPMGGVIQASDGNFYGMTYAGGTNDLGTIFRFTPEGVLTTLHSFCDPPYTCNPNDGAGPTGQLLQASDGALYGVSTGNSLFRITTEGRFTLLYTFPNGSNPVGNLVQIPSGAVYGVTQEGGAYNQGSIFKATLAGVTTVYSFCAQQGCPDGQHPGAGLALGSDGNLYGATYVGGADDFGTVFRITPKGKFTVVHTFTGFQNGGTDGGNPTAPMTIGSDGNLYGTAQNYGGGGEGGTGAVYEVGIGGYISYGLPTDLCTLAHPLGGLVQATSGGFFGSDNGTCLIGFSMGLGPFVQPIPTFGNVGTVVIIQGTDLTSTSGVTFNGKSAAFKVLSATEIETRVPTGATSGVIEVKTPDGTLSSNVQFTVN